MELKEISVPTRPDHIMDTMYGTVTYQEWVEKEKTRLEAQGRTVEIRRTQRDRTGKRGLISLWANNVGD